jgi:hypothetical protein
MVSLEWETSINAEGQATMNIQRRHVIAMGGAVASSTYLFLLRPWHLRWGTTRDEVTRPLPGDDIVPDPKFATTHAVTVHASARDIWPWLVQMGQGRGGFYSYDWLENLFELDIHNANRIMSEYQSLERGDQVSLAPNGAMPMTVMVLQPERALVLASGVEGDDAQAIPGDYMKGEIASSWAFVLHPLDERTTRLIIRWRADWRSSAAAALVNAIVLEPVHFIMERRMLLGIKERAERAVSEERGAHTAAA